MWLRDIGPTDALRRWFSHDPEKWQEFKKRYEAELENKRQEIQQVRKAEKEHGTVTLLYSAKDEEHNQAVALDAYLRKK